MTRVASARRPRLEALLAAVAALLLAACSQSSQPEPSAAPSGTYVDPSFDYSLKVEPPFQQGELTDVNPGSQGNEPPASTVMFYDSTVAVSREHPPAGLPKGEAEEAAKNLDPGVTVYPVSLAVSVFPLAVPVTEANLPEAAAQLKTNVLPQLVAGQKPPALTATTVAGRSAYRAALTVPAGDSPTSVPLRTELYWVFAEDNQYQVTLQAPAPEWSKYAPTMAKMLASLTLPGTWETSSPSATPTGSPSGPTGSPTKTRSPTPSR